MIRHQNTCDGPSPLQCPTCYKTFTTRMGKYQHLKNVKCSLSKTETTDVTILQTM